MTRVLFWNINNFSANGFYPPPGARPRSVGDDGEYGAPAATEDANDRKAVLLAVVAAVQPDLISIVEVQPGAAEIAAGALVADQSSIKLLEGIQGAGFEGAAEFRLVPPLASGTGGRTEGIATYYRRDRLQFLGPWGWSGAAGLPIAAIPGEVPAEYPVAWRNLASREIPEGWPNAGRWEDELAGQCSFSNAEGIAINFPEAIHRTPWLTYFRDFSNGAEAGGGEEERLLKLLSFHAPAAPAATAITGVQRLARIEEIRAEAIEGHEVRCVVGDFNVSSTNEAARGEAFNPLTERNFAMQFDPAAAEVGEELPWGAYYFSFLLAGGQANPWISEDKEARLNGYPGFGYLDNLAIDNALARHGAEAGAAESQTVCNPVTASPYNLDPERGEVPAGTIAVGSQLANPAIFDYAPPENMGIDFAAAEAGNEEEEKEEERLLGVEEAFREWANYTHVRSCSDHLPIALDI